ncbi:hypothetical protein BDN72DRAFT_859286 [Pluteus cervinus]|uniref:Uncharacterized protein n=1 Tax=Pluteus cervinus TaxID=181527 RepID=A0ACD3ANE5_9AGAR|nr:hypothetical protein BDN72DRAFT_859286 [Pluteus cervinus]
MPGDNDDTSSVFSFYDPSEPELDAEKPATIGGQSLDNNPAPNPVQVDRHSDIPLERRHSRSDQSSDDNPAPNTVDRHSDIPLAQRHHRFFIREEFVTLKVDAVYFNIPSFVLKENSKKFCKILEGGEELEAKLPSRLEDITAVDLERFFGVVFLANYQVWNLTTVEEWTSVLKVARQWEANSMYHLALSEIKPDATPLDLVVLGAQYHIADWLREGRLKLCRREERITLEEATRMGMEEAIKISAARHHIRPSKLRRDITDSKILSATGEENVDENPDHPAGPGSHQGGKQESASTVKVPSMQKPSASLKVEEPQNETKPLAIHEPQPNDRTTTLPEVSPAAAINVDADPPVPGIFPTGPTAPQNSAQIMVTDDPPATQTPAAPIVSRQVRISRALELRKRLHDLNGKLGKLDEEAVRMDSVQKKKTRVMEDRERLKEELKILFEGLDAIESPSSQFDLAGMSGQEAAAFLEGLLEQHLHPGVATTTLTFQFSKTMLHNQELKVYDALKRYGLKYTWDPSDSLKASVKIPLHGCLPPSA